MAVLKLLCVALVAVISTTVNARGINGGISCAACTIIAGIFGQAAEINNASVMNVTLNICDHLPGFARRACRDSVQVFDPLLRILTDTRIVTPDSFCYALNFCHKDDGQKMCFLFPRPAHRFVADDIAYVQDRARPYLKEWFRHTPTGEAYNICQIPGLKDVCEYLEKNFSDMKPLYDDDADGFSSLEFWRGSNWRGRDCADSDSAAYPGRQPEGADALSDNNCNGIWGVDQTTGIPWESKLCGAGEKSSSRGLIMLGDSIGAHFHFPEVWFNPMLISKDTLFKNWSGLVSDELDWPEYSFSTGFKNITEDFLIQGNVDSIYMRMRKRNLCNHRDYQNVCRNGATSFDLLSNVRNIARMPTDKPATVLLGVFGNDVCNWFPDTLSKMTSPKQFYKNIKAVIKSLDAMLPRKSHIVLIGLVDGSFIYDAWSDHLHPIGQYRRDVTYHNVFEWFECMQLGPCNGWLSANNTIRKATTKRAMELSQVLKGLAASYKTANVKLHYLDNPLSEVMWNWKTKGGLDWQLLEPVDGFHPNQIAQPLIAEILWKNLKKFIPDSIGLTNPHNQEILKVFGDQGGH